MDLMLALLVGALLGLVVGRAWSRRDDAVLAASFTGLATDALRASESDSRTKVATLVEPLREQLGLVQGQLHGLAVDRARVLGELHEQVASVRRSNEQLGRETAGLVDALRRPQARGQWGEVQLRRVVEHAGMLARCDFSEQVTLAGPDGPLRPDLVVHLAGGRSVAVDAKVTLAAYLEAAETTDPRVREERTAAHARHLRQHVDRLADKAYWAALPGSPEFVVLFVPGEAFLAPALEYDPSLLEHAWSRNVHLATPTTLVSLLRTMAYAWQQDSLTEDAQQIVAAGRELLGRLTTFGAHVDKLGRSLGVAVGDYNKAVGSLERSVLPSARRISDLGGLEAAGVPALVEALPRPLSAPELVDDRGENGVRNLDRDEVPALDPTG